MCIWYHNTRSSITAAGTELYLSATLSQGQGAIMQHLHKVLQCVVTVRQYVMIMCLHYQYACMYLIS